MKALITTGDKFLLVRQLVEGKEIWDFPGGKVDWGENPYNTLSREVKEETDLDIEIKEPVGVYYFFRVTDKNQISATVFHCVSHETGVDLGNNPVNESNDEMKIDDFRWFTSEEFFRGNYETPHESMNSLIRMFHEKHE